MEHMHTYFLDQSKLYNFKVPVTKPMYMYSIHAFAHILVPLPTTKDHIPEEKKCFSAHKESDF